MGFFSKIIRAVTKPIKKIIKSPLGKAAMIGGLGYLAMGGAGGGGLFKGLGGGKGSLMAKLFGTAAQAGTGGAGAGLPFLAEKGFTAGTKGLIPSALGWIKSNPMLSAGIASAGIGGAAALGAAKQPTFDQLNANKDTAGHDQYLNMRGQFGFGDPSSQYYQKPLWTSSEGGRVPAQGGLFAGEGTMTTDQGSGQGIASVMPQEEEIAEDTTMTSQEDNQMMQTESESSQLIALIQQLASLGIPMEQLRGRTMEELIEMMVYVSSQLTSRRPQEDVMTETEEVQTFQAGGDTQDPEYKGWKQIYETNKDAAEMHPRHQEFITKYESERVTKQGGGRMDYYGEGKFLENEVQESNSPSDVFITDSTEILRGKPDGSEGGITNTNAAMGTEHPVIPSKDGEQLDMRHTGGYQPHGAKEKKDDVRALLAQGEFVMTSDAVRGLGGGDREAGAKKMYDMMHNLEAMA